MTSKRSAHTTVGRNKTPALADVSGRWLLRAIFVALACAAACVYLAICIFFYFDQWQLAFQPPRPAQSPMLAPAGMTIEDIRFNYTETGNAQLDGWWIPAEAGAPYANAVVLVCHSGSSSLPQNVSLLHSLHTLGINVFALDYRGFGHSMAIHPSEQSVYADGVAALRYLADTRHAEPHRVIVYGDGIGAAVAVHIAQQQPGIAGIVLQNARASLLPEILREPRVHLLPVPLLFHNRFDIQSVLAILQTPKLFLITGEASDAQATELYKQTAQPRQLARINTMPSSSLSTAIAKFLRDTLH